jgi:RNA polymerase sigma factor (sigma-70 family)
MALYRNRSRIRDPLKIPAWLISTARRRAIWMLRQQSQQTGFPEVDEVMEMPALPDEELLRLERLDILQHAMEQLDERCQKLLMALFLSPETMSYNEIAETLKISPNAMGPLRSRCLKRLRKILDEMGYLLH